jgi:hypothetical protein
LTSTLRLIAQTLIAFALAPLIVGIASDVLTPVYGDYALPGIDAGRIVNAMDGATPAFTGLSGHRPRDHSAVGISRQLINRV